MPYQMAADNMLVRCPKCREQFLYNEKEKVTREYSLPDQIIYITSVKCPKCNCGIVIPF